MNLYLDIETIPSQSPEVHAAIAETITCPGNISKPESIAAWAADKKPGLVKETIAKTSFDGSAGHVCCIGWAWDDDAPQSASINFVDEECAVLTTVMQDLAEQAAYDKYHDPVLIGHNIVNFDIRFLWQRAIVLGVRMPRWFPRDPKPWGTDTFDTMTAFAGQRGTIGMDRLCRALGIPGKDEVDGSMVAQMWADGKFSEIAEYCRADVERTRAIHQKMMIAYGAAA